MSDTLRQALAIVLQMFGALWGANADRAGSLRKQLEVLWPSLAGDEQDRVQELVTLLFQFQQKIDPTSPDTLGNGGRRVVILSDDADD